MSIEIANRNSQIYANNLKSENADKKEINRGNFSNILSSKLSNNGDNLDQIFERAAKKYNVPVNLLKSVAKAESGFNPKAESTAGAQGIMQLMPATAKSLGVTNSFDPEQNIMGGAKYLRQMLDKFDGNMELSLAAYNAGPGNVIKYEGIPPFRETQNYVTKVMGYYGQPVSANLVTESFNIAEANAEMLSTNTYGTGLYNFNINNDNQASALMQILQGTGLTDILNNDDINQEDYALMAEMYRFKAQLSMINSGLDSESIF